MIPFLAVIIQEQAAKEFALANVEAKAQGVSQTSRQIAAAKALREISSLIPASPAK